MFREIRRKDRILDNELAIRLLEEAEYGFLAMSGINGYGYGIPINYVKEGDSIYFHCAPEGYKLECLRENTKVSFTVVGATQIVPGKFTTGYESTIAFGEMHLDLPFVLYLLPCCGTYSSRDAMFRTWSPDCHRLYTSSMIPSRQFFPKIFSGV